MKHWVNTERKHLLAIDQDRIYVNKKFESNIFKINPGREDLGLEESLQIPFHNIDRINLIDNRNELQIFYGIGSSESVFMPDDFAKREIYSICKAAFPNAHSYSFTPTFYQVGRSQIIGAIVVFIVFITSIALEKFEINPSTISNEYTLILAIVKGFSDFGLTRTTIAYCIVTGLILLRLRKKISEIEKMDVIQVTPPRQLFNLAFPFTEK